MLAIAKTSLMRRRDVELASPLLSLHSTSTMSLPQLSLTPHTPSTLPSDLSLFIQAATSFLESFPSPSSGWKQGKTISSVETFTRKKQTAGAPVVGGDAFWAARRSVHPSADYITFKVSENEEGKEG